MPQMHQFLKLASNSGKINVFQAISVGSQDTITDFRGKTNPFMYLFTHTTLCNKVNLRRSKLGLWPEQPQIWALKKSAPVLALL